MIALLLCAVIQPDLSRSWMTLSEDGKMIASLDFGERYEVGTWKVTRGDHAYYLAGSKGASSATVNQLSNARMALDLSRLGATFGKDNTIKAQSALTSNILGACFSENSWRIAHSPEGATVLSLWVAILHADRRGGRPNAGMRLDKGFVLVHMQFIAPETVAVTGFGNIRRNGTSNERFPLGTVSSYKLRPRDQTMQELWTRELAGVRLMDSAGVVVKQGKNWSFVDGPSGRIKPLPLNRQPDAYGLGRVLYREGVGTTVYNLKNGSKHVLKGFFVRLVSGTARMAIGDSPKGRLVTMSVP